MTQRPSVLKSAALLITAGAGMLALINLPAGHPDPGSLTPLVVIEWWSSVGTGPAAMMIATALAVVVAAYLTLVGAISLAASLASLTGRFRLFGRIWNSVTGPGVKRLLTVGAIVAASAGPATAASPGETPPPIVLVDLGPVDGLPGGTNPTPAVDTVPDIAVAAPPVTNVWIVKPGDHLWRIAEQTLGSITDDTPSVGAVTRYWRRLIAENFASSDLDPDLIVPGQIVTLPPV